MTANIPNLMTIWYYDEHISIDVQRQIKIHLHQTFNYSRTFDCLADFTGYLATTIVQRIILIITSKKAKYIECLAQRRQQRLSVYELPFVNQKSSLSLDPACMHLKIKTSFDTIIHDLNQVKLSPENAETSVFGEETMMEDTALPFGIFKSIPAQHSFCYLNKESLKFLLCQSLIELFITMPYDQNAFTRMCRLLRMDYQNNSCDIDKFEDNYDPTKAIYYYTRASFLFRVINGVLRLYDVDRIYRFGCYIADLYNQLEELGNAQKCHSNRTSKTVFRGKKLSSDILQQLKDNIGHPISMNGFLSTTERCDVASMFAGIEGIQNEYQSVIFEMRINNTSNLTRPYANISELSAIEDDSEILFSMGFVWKIKSMEEMSRGRWYIVLESCEGDDPDLVTCIGNFKSECPFLAIGNILQALGDSANAKNFYQFTTDDKSVSEEIRGHAHYNISLLAADRGEYMDQHFHLLEAEKLIQQTATPKSTTPNPPRPLFSHNIIPSRIRILNNIGNIDRKQGNDKIARECFEKALKEPGSDVDKAVVLNNYGLLEFQCRDYNKAREHFEQAVQLAANDACITEFKMNLELTQNILSEIVNAQTDTN
jgi:tetratricopeptide (TPR) repeat protein